MSKCVVGSGEAEREIARDGVEVVAAEAKAGFDRDHVVEIDERVDLRQPVAGEHALDQPLHRGSVTGLLDAESTIGRAPRRDAGNCGELDAGPALAASRLGRRNLVFQDRRTLLGDGQALGNDQGDSKIGKSWRQIRDDELGHQGIPSEKTQIRLQNRDPLARRRPLARAPRRIIFESRTLRLVAELGFGLIGRTPGLDLILRCGFHLVSALVQIAQLSEKSVDRL
jgi:hypothetical protein